MALPVTYATASEAMDNTIKSPLPGNLGDIDGGVAAMVHGHHVGRVSGVDMQVNPGYA